VPHHPNKVAKTLKPTLTAAPMAMPTMAPVLSVVDEDVVVVVVVVTEAVTPEYVVDSDDVMLVASAVVAADVTAATSVAEAPDAAYVTVSAPASARPRAASPRRRMAEKTVAPDASTIFVIATEQLAHPFDFTAALSAVRMFATAAVESDEPL